MVRGIVGLWLSNEGNAVTRNVLETIWHASEAMASACKLDLVA